MFICSLDAEKCFDSIWHDGLFYKLIEILPLSHWLFLYQLYGSLQATVRWDGGISAYFRVTRGTKQASILSPVLFNIFINDLLQELTSSDLGIKIGSSTFNSFAYADDVTLLSLCCKDLQLFIDLCESYAKKWRFSFGINKTKCMAAGRMPFKSPPRWKLGGKLIQNVEEIEILGTVFSSNCHMPVILRSVLRRAVKQCTVLLGLAARILEGYPLMPKHTCGNRLASRHYCTTLNQPVYRTFAWDK